jgi:putative spermidine/putrescine transport system permease protein
MFHRFLLLTPALLVVVGLFGGGLLLAVAQSVGFWPLVGESQFTTAAYTRLLADPLFYRSLGLTVWVAAVSTAVSTTLGVAGALALRRPFAGQRWVRFLFQLNIPIPHLVGAIAILFLFSQSGLFARLAYLLGAIQQPRDFPALVFDPYGIGIILEYVWKTTCFTGAIVLASLQGMGKSTNRPRARWEPAVGNACATSPCLCSAPPCSPPPPSSSPSPSAPSRFPSCSANAPTPCYPSSPTAATWTTT